MIGFFAIPLVVAALATGEHTVAPPAVQKVDIEEHVGRVVPLSLPFTDSRGRAVTLGDVVSAEQPTVLVLAYYRCPMLCGLTLRGLAAAVQAMDLELGKDFRAVTVSFNPKDNHDEAARSQATILSVLGRANSEEARDAWPFLVGSESSIRALTDAVGFRYARDERTGEYAHAAVIFVLGHDGKLVRYLYGVRPEPRDLKLALLETPEGSKAASFFDRVLMTCYRYDPAIRRYGPYIQGFLRIGAAVIFLVVASLVFYLWRLERRQRRSA